MIGIIITGHGEFGYGLTSALNLIIGKQDHYEYINFLETDSSNILMSKIQTVINNMSDCDNIIIFTDLVGGTPFKTSAMIGNSNNKIKVVSGTNLGMLIDCILSRNLNIDINELLSNVIENGKNQIIYFKGIKVKEEYIENGI